MTSLVLVAPTESRTRRNRPAGRLLWVVGVGLVMAGIFGSVVWALGYSPLGFERFSLDGGARSVTFDAVGEYVVYEERVGDAPASLTTLVVQSSSGERIPTSVAADGESGAVRRNLPMFAAWEVARFTVTAPGTYNVYAVRSTPSEPRPSGTLALVPVDTTRWMGTWFGLAVFGAVPAMLGAAVLAAAVRRDRAGSPG